MDARITRPPQLYDWINAALDESPHPNPQDAARDALAKLSPDERHHLFELMAETLFLDRAYERADDALGAATFVAKHMRPGETLSDVVERMERED